MNKGLITASSLRLRQDLAKYNRQQRLLREEEAIAIEHLIVTASANDKDTVVIARPEYNSNKDHLVYLGYTLTGMLSNDLIRVSW